MNVILPIPDDLAIRLGSADDVARRALTAFAAAEHQAGRLTEAETSRLLGVATSDERHAFFHEQDRQAEATAADQVVARFQAFASDHTLGGLDLKQLISEGRRRPA
jgi:hypothetical protein